MTTPRDLVIVALEGEPSPPVERGDLSLALAGAELIDLLAAEAVRLDGERIVPVSGASDDSLVRQPPYESVEDWLWRRGRGLADLYLASLEADGHLTRERRRRPFHTPSPPVPTDSPARRAAAGRLASHDPVLTALASAAGVPDTPPAESPAIPDDSVATVLGAVHDAVTELQAVRQRRAIEQAAFDNIWRAPGGA
jgi:hypothetical protein